MLRDHRPHSGETKTTTDPRVEALLSAAAAPTEAGRLAGEEEALSAFRALRPTSPVRAPSRLTVLKRSLAGAVGAGLLLTGGVAAAVTGSLPGAAQNTADGWLEQVGVAVPGADERAGIHPEERGSTGRTDDQVEGAGTPAEPEAAEHGRKVSELAQETEETGADKGAAVSELASQGRSHAGEDHPGDNSAPHESGDAPNGTGSEAGETHARVEVPNHGAASGSSPGQAHD